MNSGIFIRWILGGIAFLVLFGAACIFWYQHDTAPYRQEAAITAEEVREWEAAQKVDMNNVTEEVTITPAKSNTQTAEKIITKIAPEVGTIDTASSETKDTPVETPLPESTDGANISPYGFGPYPEIPEGYPLLASWTRLEEFQEKFSDNIWKELELMDRVLIKLFNEGDTSFQGGIVNNNLVLPIYPNVAYVRLEEDQTEDWAEDGNLIEIDSKSSRILAGSGVSEADKEKIRSGEKPPGIEIRSFSDGINPYTFLELQ